MQSSIKQRDMLIETNKIPLQQNAKNVVSYQKLAVFDSLSVYCIN